MKYFALIIRKKGMTIIELVVAIAVIAILTAIAIPSYSGYISATNQSVDKANLKMLETAGAMYISVAEEKPVAGTGLTAEELGAFISDGIIPKKQSGQAFTIKVNAERTGVDVS